MENKLRIQNLTCIANTSQPNFLAMHKNSYTISKIKPKIRITHIIAPEIIKTDGKNFRQLVQKLTGKPSGDKKFCKKKTGVVELEESRKGNREQESRSTSSGSGSGLSSKEFPRMMTIMKNEVSNGGFWGLDLITKVKEEVGTGGSNDEISCGGYLGGFSDLEGFIYDINYNGGFPLFHLDHATHNMQGFEQYQLL